MRKRYAVMTGLALSPLLLVGYLWLTMLSPLTYDRPEHLPPIVQGEHQVFVYGTLRYPLVRWWVYGRTGSPEPARLQGFRRTGLDLEPAEDEVVEGLLLTVDHHELARLDRYERLGIRYERVAQRLTNGQIAWVYLRL
ncbi:Gamma-glutamyl cyclotransferase, AIG2-like [Franzmannia pantelleriensis]|uniref:Gamma-glutamyl cyclotransferase, AIG2-like n=1 Tax=Franzmannia pantelleriensis TaxID=48727 RepID=A0A1G9EZ75_9GAMM|nr:gamma-glutamylcyclotransferase family protein [Halomonas pantelleriensis]SDK81361.1 Gamma-glutamyl cyclotransferase, AIG2-like [Halomonas pantelleriensis]